MQPLSPRKFILTKARLLPICKCMVNKDWAQTQLAHVTVMRKHTNGNVTIGIYMVDLLCLGVKDTVYFFNIQEEEFLDRYREELAFFDTIDYNLAHNIIFAGHDFAMEFDIHPHRDFEITRFILQEDDDAIPLIDIQVGVQGIPHLMAPKHGAYADALAKLKQYAGEGNYMYTVATDDGAIDKKEEDTYPYATHLSLDAVLPGEVNLGNVQEIHAGDMLNNEKVMQRNMLEQTILHAELLTRLLPPEMHTCSPEEEMIWNEMWDEWEQGAAVANNVTAEQYDESVEFLKKIDGLSHLMQRDNEQLMQQYEEKLMELFTGYAKNPVCVNFMYEYAVFFELEQTGRLAKESALNIYTHFPLLQFNLALGALIQNERDSLFEKIYTQQDIRMAVPGYEQYHASEVVNFWLIKLWLCLEQKDIAHAVQYYFLLVDARAANWLLQPVLEQYVETLYLFNKKVKNGQMKNYRHAV